ncbi:MAG: alpha/beta hydrolase-fold protein [candidate division WOR-3 bacterium]
MKRFLVLLSLGLFLIYGCKKAGQEVLEIKKGKIEEVIINVHPALGIVNPKALVYLPPDYDPNKKYPVIYMLHGFGGDYRTYVYYNGVNEILDYMISTGQMDPVIVVMPDGRNLVGGSFYTNSRLYDPSSQTYMPLTVFGDYETYMIDSLVAQIERKYPVKGGRENRAIMGLSMGSYGSAKLWLKHADMFGVVALHSGPLAFDMLIDENVVDSLLKDFEEIGGKKLWIKDYLGREHPWLTLGNGLSAAFTPRVVPYSNPTDWRVIQNCYYPGGLDSINGDFLLDTMFIPSFGIKVCVGVRFPMRWDTTGPYASCLTTEQQAKPNAKMISEDFCVWKKYHDPYTLIDSAEINFPTEFRNTKVYIDVGLKDELTLLSHNRKFKDKLRSKGLTNIVYVEFDGALGYPAELFPGKHSNWLYARLKKSFTFINRAFKGEDIKAGEYKQYEGKDYE